MTALNETNHDSWASSLAIEKSRVLRISGIAVPMIAAALATNMMTFVDTLMVGQLGNAALGGVGIGGQLFFLLLSVALGLTAGVQAMVARRVGEDQLAVTGKILNAGLLLALGAGTVLMVLGYLLAPLLFSVINNDVEVVGQGLAYLATRLPSLILMSLTLTFRSYWVGVSLAKWSMVSIVILSFANVFFNYVFIFGHLGAPEMGVAGAGLGSTLAVLVGLLVNVGFAVKLAITNGFLRGLPDAEQIFTIVKIAYPESIRQTLFTVSVVTLYILIGQIGTTELAAFHVIISICLIAYMPHIGIGGAATTLVGEALGRRELTDAKVWGWQISNLGLIVLFGLALMIVIFPEPVLAVFFTNPAMITAATLPLQLAVLAHVMDGYGKILGAALIGAGATAATMKLTLVPQYLILLPALAIAVFSGYGLIEAMMIFLGSTIITAVLFVSYWQRGHWTGIQV